MVTTQLFRLFLNVFMSAFTKLFYAAIVIISTTVIGATLLSLWQNTNTWWMKVLDFPRLQALVIALLCLMIVGVMTRRWTAGAVALMSGLAATVALQSYFIYPYTTLPTPVVPTTEAREGSTVSLLIANVYMHNREVEPLLDMIERTDPDMVLVMETNAWWFDTLRSLRTRYEHVREYPADNTYGMGLYSRYPWKNMRTEFLQHDSVPSFHAEIELPSGQPFSFHGVHPVPPILSKHPDNRDRREVELLKVGQMVTDQKLPAVVAGDFNDVAWSNTSRLFQVDGSLNDIRVGRGLFNTFSAHSSVMRWPLDHVYVTDEFAVADFYCLDSFGSDHFPVYVELVLKDE